MRSGFFHKWGIVFLVCALFGSIAWAVDAASVAFDAPSERLTQIKNRGELIVGVKTDYPPFGQLNKDGLQEGFEHDLAQSVAQHLGVRLVKVSVTGANRLQKLEAGVVDLVLATMGDTAERRKLATLIEPNYYASGVTLFMRPDQPISEWMGMRGQEVCATQGSYFNREMAQRYLLNLKIFNSARDAKLAVRDRQCVGYLFDNTAIIGDLALPEWQGYKAPLEPALVTPWAVAIAASERGTQFERILGDLISDWHRTGFLMEREKAWGLPPSKLLAELHVLWSKVGEDGRTVCERSLSGQWPAACRNQVFLNAIDSTGLRQLGLWWKEYSGMDLTLVYDEYDRKKFLWGLATTVLLMLFCVAGSLVFGFFGALLSEARIVVLSGLVRMAATVGRMTPPLLQIYLIVFGLGSMLVAAYGISLSPIAVVIGCLSFYTGASIMMAFIESANVVRLKEPSFQMRLGNFRKILPMSSASVTAALINVSKATMMASAVAVPELLSAATSIMAESGNVAVMMNALLLTFLLLIVITTRCLALVDQWLHKRQP